MATISAEEVQRLNERIEKLNTAKTKAEAQAEILKKSLSEGLEKYEKEYGISLKGSTLDNTRSLVVAERNLVNSLLEEEFTLKEKIVSAIEKGDYSTANQLLGVGDVEEEQLISVEEEVGKVVNNSLFGKSDYQGDFSSYESAIPDISANEVVEDKPKSSTSGFVVGGEADEDYLGLGDFTGSVQALSDSDNTSSVPDESLKEEPSSTISFGGFVVEEEEEDDDFGFGDLLSGTKFETGV